MKVLIVDDERAARHRIKTLLSHQQDIDLVGEAKNGREAVEAIRSLSPDLVFLDVQMPALTGMEVLQTIGTEKMPAVIFVTAYDEYAINAFDVAALDYLLKPFDDERFAQALERARSTLASRTLEEFQDRLESLLDTTVRNPDGGSRYQERIGVELRGQIRIVPVDQIDYIAASGAYAEVHAGDDTFLINDQMQELEEKLDPNRFFRIHRSTIVRLDRVESLHYKPGGDYHLELHDGHMLRVSRGRYEELQRRLGLESS